MLCFLGMLFVDPPPPCSRRSSRSRIHHILLSEHSHESSSGCDFVCFKLCALCQCCALSMGGVRRKKWQLLLVTRSSTTTTTATATIMTATTPTPYSYLGAILGVLGSSWVTEPALRPQVLRVTARHSASQEPALPELNTGLARHSASRARRERVAGAGSPRTKYRPSASLRVTARHGSRLSPN